jgi:DNA-binding transcriptional MerR regulator
MPYKVKEVAEMAGVSVRTLHHYDRIGLLHPETVTPAGYRLYTDRNLERLQQILFFKEIGFTLQEIKQIIDSPHFDRKKALQSHREWLLEKKKRLEEMIKTVDRTILSLEGGIRMEGREMFEGFDMTAIEQHREKYADEAKRLYGKEIVEETERRTSRYTKEDWAAVMGKWDDLFNRIAAAMDKGPADLGVQQAVGELRQPITDSFYDCTVEIFRGLGDLYVNDERFTANIDRYKPGLASFLRKAMHLYCDNLEKA